MSEHHDIDSGTAVEDDDVLLDLDCPSCGSDLLVDDSFLTFRVCGSCGRHFAINARERLSLLVDAGGFEELSPALGMPAAPGTDELVNPGRQAKLHDVQIIGDAVVTGVGRISGVDAVLIALDEALVGSMPGALLTDKIIHALDYACSNHLPLVIVCAGGSSPQVGPLAPLQAARLASVFAQVHLEGVFVSAVLVHPVSPAIYGAIASQADLVLAEPGVQIGTATLGMQGISARVSAERLVRDGWVDELVGRPQLAEVIGRGLDLVCNARVEGRLARIGQLWARHQAALGNQPEVSLPFNGEPQDLCDHWQELRGDRVDGDDPHVRGGIGRIDESSLVLVCIDVSASNVDARAARKIMRLARFAGRMELPLVLLLQGGKVTPDVQPFAPDRLAAASSLAAMLGVLPVPVVTIGSGALGGWLAPSLLGGDRVVFLEDAGLVVSTAGPGVPSMPSRMPGRGGDQLSTLSAASCERLGVIDGVIRAKAESLGGAIRNEILESMVTLAATSPRRLVDTRSRKVRSLGLSTPEGVAAIRLEMKELQEWQRSVGKSIDDLRERWEQIRSSQNRRSFQKPEFGDIAARIRARRTELVERARSGDRS